MLERLGGGHVVAPQQQLAFEQRPVERARAEDAARRRRGAGRDGSWCQHVGHSANQTTQRSITMTAMDPAPDRLRALFAGGPRPRCSVASPLGFSEAGRDYYARRYLPALAEHVEPVDPWALASPDEFAAARAQGREHELGIEVGARNAQAIASAEVLVAHLDGQE